MPFGKGGVGKGCVLSITDFMTLFFMVVLIARLEARRFGNPFDKKTFERESVAFLTCFFIFVVFTAALLVIDATFFFTLLSNSVNLKSNKNSHQDANYYTEKREE